MSNSRFLLANLVPAGTLLNGTGGGEPARDETAPFVMENALNADRYTPWQTSATPGGTLDFDIDLGAAKNVACAAVHGFRQAGFLPMTFGVQSSPDKITWTPRGSATVALSSLPARDAGSTFTQVAARYWRFEFTTFAAQFSVGRFALGVLTDLGAIGAPGLQFARNRTRLETPLPSGAVVLRDLGDPGATFQMPWQYATSAKIATLLSLRDQTGSFTFFDGDDNVWEVYVRGGQVTATRRWTSLFDEASDLVVMP